MLLRLLLGLTQAPCKYPAAPVKETPAEQRALEHACRAHIKANPSDTTSYLVLGHALMNSPAARLEVYQAGLSVAPENFQLLINAGLTLRQLDRLEESLQALAHAARVDTTDADALVQAGLVAHDLHRFGHAIQLFRNAIRRHDDGHTWGYMARSMHALGRRAEAVAAWDRAERLSPHGFIDEAENRDDYNQSRAAIGLSPVRP